MAAYIAGYNNTADVAGFGFNAQSAMFYQSQHTQHDDHNGVVCDSCGANPLRGTRWRCQTCPDHDICGDCRSRGAGAGHRLQSVSVAQTNDALNGAPQGFQVPQDTGVHWTTCKGCQEYPIRGTLYTCMVCPGFDMVSSYSQPLTTTLSQCHAPVRGMQHPTPQHSKPSASIRLLLLPKDLQPCTVVTERTASTELQQSNALPRWKRRAAAGSEPSSL